jgi:hypothetical protein
MVQPGAGDEHQPELADLHLIAVAQGGRLDPLAVDVRPVEAAHVAHGEPGAAAVELGVPAGHRHVVEEDVAVRVAAAGGHVVVEQEPRPGVGSAPHDQQGDPGRQRRHAARNDLGVPRLQHLVHGPHVQRRGDVERGVLVVWARHVRVHLTVRSCRSVPLRKRRETAKQGPHIRPAGCGWHQPTWRA